MPNPTTLLTRYLGGLPSGAESYPECLVKGTVARSFLLGAVPEAAVDRAGLPPPIEAVLRSPPSNSVWISEVCFFGALLAVRDLLDLDEPAWKQWFKERNLQALTNPVLRLVMNATSPEMLLSLSGVYWGVTHRGSKLSVLEKERGGAKVALDHPHNLVNADIANVLTVALTVPLFLSRAKSPSIVLTSSAPTRSTFSGTWR